jgi:ParB/RepB/Spo0J family partition protein
MDVKDIPLGEIHADSDFNCRGVIAPIDVVDLARSIDANQLQNALVIQPYDEAAQAKTGFKYRLISGYRRFKALQLLEKPVAPCNIVVGLTDIQARLMNLDENLARKDLNIVQEAKALEKLYIAGMTQEQVAADLHQSRGWVQIRYYVLTLPTEIQVEAAGGLLSQQQIRDLYTLGNKEKQFEAVRKIKEGKERGEKIKIKEPIKRPASTRKLRDRQEIFLMMDHIRESVGNNMGTRCLAWAAGEIADSDLFGDIKTLAQEKSVPYEVPKEALSPLS